MAEEIKGNAEKPGFKLENLGTNAWIGIAVVALVLGLVVGRFLLGGGSTASLNKSKLTESELNSTVATYNYKGSNTAITARQVIENTSSLQAAADSDGNYAVPSADTVITYARNAIIAQEAKSRGIEVSEDDLKNYAKEYLGSDDFATIASSYGMEEDAVREAIRQSLCMNKLRDDVVQTDTSATAPEAPTAPEGANSEDQATKDAARKTESPEFAAYIIQLAGDQWDSEAGKWKDESGAYATALAGMAMSKDSASYEAAEAAYYVAYQDYSTKQNEVSTQWTDYVNGLLGSASIQIGTLVA